MAPTGSDRAAAIAAECLDLLGSGRQVPPFSARWPDFDLPEAYAAGAALCRLRQARGETPVGRKIGFTNRAVWGGHGISAPIWAHVFDSTLGRLGPGGGVLPLAGLAEPRIEPELVLHLASLPEPGMDAAALLGCIDWVAPGFELVHSIFPRWVFAAADAAAAYGVHAALLVGEPVPVSGSREAWLATLSGFSVDLLREDGPAVAGHARNVLGGPLEALRFAVREIARHAPEDPIRAGEVVTTGTLTEAMPALPGQAWTARFSGIAFPDVRIAFR